MRANLASKTLIAALMLICANGLNHACAQEKSSDRKGQRPGWSDWYEKHREAQEAMMKEMFPNAPETARKVECFRGFSEGISMHAIVAKCGRPDGDPCSGVGCFFYDLEDGSRIWIFYSSSPTHIRTLEHVQKSGKSVSLLVRK